MQGIRRLLKWKSAVWSARIEAYLSTHAFEVLFLTMYSLAMLLLFLWGAYDEFVFTAKYVEKKGQEAMKWYLAIARGAGYTLNVNCALTVLLACRLLITTIRDTPLHRILPLDKCFPAAHIAIGWGILGGVIVHVPLHMTWIIAFDQMDRLAIWSFSMSVLTGFILLPIFVAMFVTALPRFRTKYFHYFYQIHMVGAFLFCFLILVHGVKRKSPETYKFVAAPIVCYMIDRLIRHWKVSTTTLRLSGDQTFAIGDRNILKLKVKRPFEFLPGQYAELRVPTLGKEWHPFSIASAPHEDELTFFVKKAGDWTHALCAKLEEGIRLGSSLEMNVRGPFGAPAQHVGAFERVVLISGGIGATPFASIMKHIHHLSTEDSLPLDVVQEREACRAIFSGRMCPDQIISRAVSKFYDVDVGMGGLDKSRAEHLTEILNVMSDDVKEKELEGRGRVSLRASMGVFQRDSGMEAINRKHCDVGVAQSEHVNYGNANPTDVTIDMGNTTAINSIRRYQSTRTGIFPTEILSLADAGAGGASQGSVAGPFSMQSLHEHTPSKTIQEEIARIGELRYRLFAFSHTTRVSLALLVVILVRISIGCVMAIFTLPYDSSRTFENGRWLLAVESVLGIGFTLTMLIIFGLELSYMKKGFFRSMRRRADLFLTPPFSIISCVLGIHAWLDFGLSNSFPFLHYLGFLPILFVLLSVRMYRSTVPSTFFEFDDEESQRQTSADPVADFLWTTATSAEDQWLREELIPLTNGTCLRLHRYVTRETEILEDEPGGLIASKAGRPNWDTFFQGIAESSQNRSEIGVFFCGPQVMGTAVRRSLRTTEILSNLRGAYLRSTGDEKMEADLKVGDGDVEQIRNFGSNVRFVFRTEKF